MAGAGAAPRDWIIQNTSARLDATEVGRLEIAGGNIALLDPLFFSQPMEDAQIPVPDGAADIVIFHDRDEGRNSKLAVIFADAPVQGGTEAATCFIETGMASVFTASSHAAMNDFLEVLGPDKNLYDDYFCKFDSEGSVERKMAQLPDGTPVPYAHTGWGDGAYPVFTLTDATGTLLAVYCDFMGCNDDGDWLTPPGVKPM